MSSSITEPFCQWAKWATVVLFKDTFIDTCNSWPISINVIAIIYQSQSQLHIWDITMTSIYLSKLIILVNTNYILE